MRRLAGAEHGGELLDNEASPSSGALAAFGRERYRELSDSGRPALVEEHKRRPVLRFHAARRVDRRAAVRRRSLRGPAGMWHW